MLDPQRFTRGVPVRPRDLEPVMVRRLKSDLRRFGVPYQLVWAGTFVLTFGDRYFLQASHGAAVVGLYGLAYQFGFLVGSLGYMPVMRAWNPQRFQLAAEPRPIRDARYSEGLLYLNLVIVTLGVGLCLFSTPVIAIMSSAAFFEVARVRTMCCAVSRTFSSAAAIDLMAVVWRCEG